MTDRLRRYLEYTKSEHWKALRKARHVIAGHRCENEQCKSIVDLHTHHLIYRNLTDCTTDDLMVLCEPCHNLIHWTMKYYQIDMNGMARERAHELLRWAPQQPSCMQWIAKVWTKAEKSERKQVQQKASKTKRKSADKKLRRDCKKAIRVFYNTTSLEPALGALIDALMGISNRMAAGR